VLSARIRGYELYVVLASHHEVSIVQYQDIVKRMSAAKIHVLRELARIGAEEVSEQ